MAKILIVEDERDIRDLVMFTLQIAGHEVLTAANGEEGWQLTRQEMPDLILSDVRMPKMTGYDLCRTVKATPETQHIPVVFLSAKGQDSEVQAGYEAGALDYILKPFAPDQLLLRVAEVLAKSKAKS